MAQSPVLPVVRRRTLYSKTVTYVKDSVWEFCGLYYDEGIIGTKKEKRTELLRLIADCENGKIDFIVTKSISRFARNTMDCLELVRKLVDLGIYIYFEKENLNTGDMESELMLSILSSLAESESVSISENNKWSAQRRFQNGTFKISYPHTDMKTSMGKWSSTRNRRRLCAGCSRRRWRAKAATGLLRR